ncbi:hypothetical protein ANCCEY_13622 [Ancylostoma ceylanicum]|uniref:Uncharacterized protein n=1 Tax=Ancylostoma ceylanicum TaxID=53326 RepID=A0A0D6L760_9BILA|nr:hypothetical protein ANCCEY_13622 [Ancylostoma ceylanicum]
MQFTTSKNFCSVNEKCDKLDASSSMLATVESEAMDVEQSTAAKLREMSETNRELREELYATQRELDKLRQLTESMNNEEKEAELEKLRNELIEATKCIAAQKKALQELEETLVNKDKLHGEIAAELERLRELKFGDAREELKRLTTQLTFRDEQIARLTNHCTLLQVELGTYAERSLKPQTRDASVTSKVQETQTNGVRPDVVPQSEDRPRPQQVERKPRRSSKHRDATEVNVAREAQENQSEVRVRRVFDQDIWEQQAMLMVSLYSELMQIMEEQEVKQKQMAEMEEMLFKGRRAMDDAKSQLHDTALIDLANCQNQLVRSVSIETYEKLALRFKKECVSDVLGSEIDEVARENTISIAPPTDAKTQELEAKNTYLKVQLKDNQLSDLKKELSAIEKENEDLMIAIASANLSSKPIKGMDVTEDEDKATMEENTTTTIENSAASPFLEEPQSSSEESEATSTDSERGGVKTVLQDNSKEFEKRLAKMKEAAELCIQGYKELILACEKIREDAMAELEARAPRTSEADEKTMLRMRMELEKTKKENRSLRKTIEDQRTSLESFKKEIVQKKSGEDELARWNERKRLEENLSTVRKNLAESLEREKKTREKLSKRERLLEELRKDEELRQRELERTRRKNAELQYERQENSRLLQTIEEVKLKQAESISQQVIQITSSYTNQTKSVSWKEEGSGVSKTTQTAYTSPVAQALTLKRVPKRRDVAVEAQLPLTEAAAPLNPGGAEAAVDETLLLQSKEMKKKLKKMDALLNEVTEKLKTCEKERQRLVDTNKLLVEQIECNEFGSLGAVNVLIDKLQSKDREIIQLVPTHKSSGIAKMTPSLH